MLCEVLFENYWIIMIHVIFDIVHEKAQFVEV